MQPVHNSKCLISNTKKPAPNIYELNPKKKYDAQYLFETKKYSHIVLYLQAPMVFVSTFASAKYLQIPSLSLWKFECMHLLPGYVLLDVFCIVKICNQKKVNLINIFFNRPGVAGAVL